jgi:hypothetical protein
MYRAEGIQIYQINLGHPNVLWVTRNPRRSRHVLDCLHPINLLLLCRPPTSSFSNICCRSGPTHGRGLAPSHLTTRNPNLAVAASHYLHYHCHPPPPLTAVTATAPATGLAHDRGRLGRCTGLTSHHGKGC